MAHLQVVQRGHLVAGNGAVADPQVGQGHVAVVAQGIAQLDLALLVHGGGGAGKAELRLGILSADGHVIGVFHGRAVKIDVVQGDGKIVVGGGIGNAQGLGAQEQVRAAVDFRLAGDGMVVVDQLHVGNELVRGSVGDGEIHLQDQLVVFALHGHDVQAKIRPGNGSGGQGQEQQAYEKRGKRRQQSFHDMIVPSMASKGRAGPMHHPSF